MESGGTGSSPRVRSRHCRTPETPSLDRIISACAEQTDRFLRGISGSGDHLRVCGADDIAVIVKAATEGSSPRVRSRPHVLDHDAQLGRIISACAEQTGADRWFELPRWDHLRVCGADKNNILTEELIAGSSPRVRSRHPIEIVRGHVVGIISACAEQTITVRLMADASRDHLRVCGADCRVVLRCGGVLGSSPRVRSRP